MKELLYLSYDDVDNCQLSFQEILKSLEKMFLEKGRGQCEMPPKIGVHTQPDAFIHAMPAVINSEKASGMKWVSGYPDNQKKGLPYISGLLILNDFETGIPIAIMDCTWITAMRTAVASLLAAKLLANPKSKSMGLLGLGVQGESHFNAFTEFFPIEDIYAFDIDEKRAASFKAKMQLNFNGNIHIMNNPKAAVEQSDLIISSSPILKRPSPIIEESWLKPQMFGSAVDFDSYWKPAAMESMDLIATDDHSQFQYYKEIGYFQKTPTPKFELSELVNNPEKYKHKKESRTLAINLGIALEDMAVAHRIFQTASTNKIGTILPF